MSVFTNPLVSSSTISFLTVTQYTTQTPSLEPSTSTAFQTVTVTATQTAPPLQTQDPTLAAPRGGTAAGDYAAIIACTILGLIFALILVRMIQLHRRRQYFSTLARRPDGETSRQAAAEPHMLVERPPAVNERVEGAIHAWTERVAARFGRFRRGAVNAEQGTAGATPRAEQGEGAGAGSVGAAGVEMAPGDTNAPAVPVAESRLDYSRGFFENESGTGGTTGVEMAPLGVDGRTVPVFESRLDYSRGFYEEGNESRGGGIARAA